MIWIVVFVVWNTVGFGGIVLSIFIDDLPFPLEYAFAFALSPVFMSVYFLCKGLYRWRNALYQRMQRRGENEKNRGL